MKKYMFVIPSLSKGGAERVISILSSTLAEADREVTVLTYYKTKQDYPVSDKVKLLCLSGGYEDDYKSIKKPKMLKMLRKIIKDENPDYLIPFLNIVGIQVFLARFLTKYKVIYTMRIDPAVRVGSKKFYMLRDFLINHSKCTIVQNENQRDYFPEKARKHIHVMPNPVNTEFFSVEYGKKSDKTVIVGTGRLAQQKNFPMLIDCAKTLSEKYDNLEFRIYGDGGLYDSLNEKIKENGLEDTVFLMGRTLGLADVYAETDIFAMTSNFEGMPNALMEAMAAGVASVSTDCPTGPSDIIESGKNGLLVPVGDTNAMTEALDFMISNPEKRAEMARAGRETIKERYMPEKIVQILIDICEKHVVK